MRMANFWLALAAAPALAAPQPVIDVHLHAGAADDQGPPPVAICVPYERMPLRDPRWTPEQYFAETFKQPKCRHPVWSEPDTARLRQRTLAELERLNIRAITSGSPTMVAAWQREAPHRIIPAVAFGWWDRPSLDALRKLHAEGRLAVMGEITTQYEGISPDDPRLEPYFALAEELDVPVAIHVGQGPPGVSYLPGGPPYNTAAADPLRLEAVLQRHPRLRLQVMHGGWPFADQMVALLYNHPQVHIDTAVIAHILPRPAFHAWLKRLTDAGFVDRIMFGSDNMVWPDTIAPAIAAITSAPFLSAADKRAILHDNAVRFFRLDEVPRR